MLVRNVLAIVPFLAAAAAAPVPKDGESGLGASYTLKPTET